MSTDKPLEPKLLEMADKILDDRLLSIIQFAASGESFLEFLEQKVGDDAVDALEKKIKDFQKEHDSIFDTGMLRDLITYSFMLSDEFIMAVEVFVQAKEKEAEASQSD